MKDIITIMPTFQRAANAKLAAKSYVKTALTKRANLIMAVSPDDLELEAYYQLTEMYNVGVHLTYGNMVEATNDVALEYADEFRDSIIGWMADDNRFVTDEWDAKIMMAFDDPKVGIVVPDDDHWHGDKATNVFMRAKVIRALGYLALDTLEHLYVDDAWIRLGVASGAMKFVPEVQVKHLNPLLTGTGVQDERHKFVNRPEQYDRDGIEYRKWLQEELASDAKKVQEAL